MSSYRPIPRTTNPSPLGEGNGVRESVSNPPWRVRHARMFSGRQTSRPAPQHAAAPRADEPAAAGAAHKILCRTLGRSTYANSVVIQCCAVYRHDVTPAQAGVQAEMHDAIFHIYHSVRIPWVPVFTGMTFGRTRGTDSAGFRTTHSTSTTVYSRASWADWNLSCSPAFSERQSTATGYSSVR